METLLPIIFANADVVSTIGALTSLAIAAFAVALMIKGSYSSPAR
jgi:hypothetical protein